MLLLVATVSNLDNMMFYLVEVYIDMKAIFLGKLILGILLYIYKISFKKILK
ncbi:hypothetical protein [Clostridioides difficile]|uniref:hypothetical protein n=1 Tax=Clostridioides difficile TaxID=1496 RepID=UPI0023E26E59|nr:hypothetical protein [Clostridioides difficile]MDF3321982.1 hypothetical protein [Clostridioides difficile]